MAIEVESQRVSKVWMWIAIAGILFFMITAINGWEVPWRNQVLFDCPPLGDGSYLVLDPHEAHPGCEHFGPPLDG